VRDLGGLRTHAGRTTRWGAVVRSDDLDRLTDAGWSALEGYGVRTIVDLRNDEERTLRPRTVTTVPVPLDDADDTDFWEACWADELDGSPLYYLPFLDRKPERCAAAVAAIAQADPGAVVFHCGAGRDRTGLVSVLLLALAGVVPEDIVADYELSNVRLRRFWAVHGTEDQSAVIADILRRKNTSARELLLELLASLDVEAYLRSGGLGDDDLAAVRARLLA
jgi:protein-tyrosine phosphatase